VQPYAPVRATSRILPAIVSLALCGCGSGPPAPLAAPAVATASASAPAPPAPAWDYHPRFPAGLRTRIELDDGSWLFGGTAGERWRADPGKDTAASAAQLADEDLIAILRPASGGFVFVGDKGSLFSAAEPLGPFTEVRRPEHKLLRVAGRASVLIGVREDGALVRSSDGGKTFSPTPFGGGRVFDIAVAGDGRALLLSAPEQLWESSDGGASFKLSAAGSIGATHAGLDASGDPVAQGLLRSLSWPKGAPGLQPLRGPIEAPELDLMTDPKPGASGVALAAGKAALEGTRYVEAVAPGKSGALWTLAVSSLIGRASTTIPIPGSTECGKILVTIAGDRIVLGCLPASRGNQPLLMPSLKLIASDDGGLQWQSKVSGLVLDDRKARIKLLRSGTLLVTAACRPSGRRMCQANAPIRTTVRVTRDGLRLGELETPEAPVVPVQATGLEVSPDGKHLYWAGRLAAGRSIAVFVSDDEGLKYKPVPLDAARVSLGDGEQDKLLLETAQLDELGIDEQGNVSLTLTTSKGRLWLVFDEQGRAGSARLLPEETPSIAAAGRRALAYGARDGVLRASYDGGGTFENLGRVPPQAQAEGAIACRAAGCAIGNALSWQGWAKAPGGIVDGAEPMAKGKQRKWLTPLVCKASGAWQTISSAERMVSAHDADRNGAAWSTIVRERVRGAVSFAVARSLPAPRVEMLRVFEQAKSGDVALMVSSQAEGMAAIRYPIDRDGEGEIRYGNPLRNVEVGWVNLYDKGVKRGKVAESGTLTPEDASGWRTGDEASANAEILSVSMSGIFVCPHNSCEGTAKLGVFIDLQGRTRPISVPVWPAFMMHNERLAVRADMIHVEGTDVPLGFAQQTIAIGRAHPAAEGFRFQAMGLLPRSARESDYRVQYGWAFMEGSQLPALSVTLVHEREPAAYARILQFRAADRGVATLLPAPLQAEAGDPPRACTPADRKASYRVIAPTSAGARHPIRIESEGKAVWLLSDDAVMYGKAGEGCVSVLDTVGTGTRESGSMHALVDVSHPSTSWLFETEQGDNGNMLQWKTMQCSFDGSLVVPDSLKPEGGPKN
jgi:hypothetical protein